MTSYSNSLDFPTLTVKSAPTNSDIILISDQAAGGIPKQSLIQNLPPQPNQVGPGYDELSICTLPGMLGALTSDNLTTGLDMNSQILFMPFYVKRPLTTADFYIHVHTGLAASTATLGVWNSTAANNDYPSGNALSVVQYDTSANDRKVQALAVSLSPNIVYWAGLQVSSAITLAINLIQQNFSGGGIGYQDAGVNTFYPLILSYTNTYSAGTMPSIVPASLTLTPATYVPFIAFL